MNLLLQVSRSIYFYICVYLCIYINKNIYIYICVYISVCMSVCDIEGFMIKQ